MSKGKFSTPGLLVGQGIGLFAALGLYCLLVFLSCFVDGSPKAHPVAFPLSILAGFLSLGAVCALFWVDVRIRKERPSILWTIVDVLLGLGGMAVYFPLIVLVTRWML